ncbi:hypothetical protein ACU6DH_004813 [Escherichia coli]|nr:hypothetical protein [Escherichia coli]MCT6145053.1 hypothetical protein [Escherichia coli]MCT6149724.1 hypothetical protein [Escherichia coli]MCT6204902.1 hypothetical protein [Escherichia coli]MCT6468185.1 hypothetical protein [Escherichia coli]MCW9854512.1 hypothetical protein [Escherichia coli]
MTTIQKMEHLNEDDMTDNEKIELMIKEIKSVILKTTGEDSRVSIVETDGCKRINILIDNVSSYLIKFSQHHNNQTK